MTKTAYLKSAANAIITASIFVLSAQLILATLFEFLSIDFINVFKEQSHLHLTFATGLPYWLTLVAHHGLWIYGLKALKQCVNAFQSSDLLTPSFILFLKKAGLLMGAVGVLKSILTYGMTQGNFDLDLSLSIYLLLASVACDYARRYMMKHGLSL